MGHSNDQSTKSQNRSSSSNYPTKEEILSNLYQPTPIELQTIAQWKQAYYKAWAATGKEYKHEALKELLNDLTEANQVPKTHHLIDEYGWRYYPELRTIIADLNHPSIISALHELGHHLFGHSELKACQYSIGLFREAFPKTYETLQFQGHMLVKKAP